MALGPVRISVAKFLTINTVIKYIGVNLDRKKITLPLRKTWKLDNFYRDG